MPKVHIPLALMLSLLFCALLCLVPAQAQTGNKRLILKDGTYQIVTQYKVIRDRVRFYSAERADWEEVPSKLVDWAATEKWAKKHALDSAAAESSGRATGDVASGMAKGAASPADAEAAAIDREEQAERSAQNESTPEVLPGLRLPDQTGVWVLDTYRARPELAELIQNSGDLNPRTGHNITRGELASSGALKDHIVFQGDMAKVQLHVDMPVFYVSLSVPGNQTETDPQALTVDTHGAPAVSDNYSFSSPSSRYVIVRVWNDMRHHHRELSPIRLDAASNPSSGDVIPTKAQILPGARWMKLTPATPLTIGDYALMEILGPGQVNLSLWDFRVDPQGPDNMNTIVPLQRASQ